MKIFFDTEFLDLGERIELVSLGAVREDGVEYYAENASVNWRAANSWVLEHVKPQLTGPLWTPAGIRESFSLFAAEATEFWAWYGTCDWLLVMQLFGGFQRLPPRWPKYFHDLETLRLITGLKKMKLPRQETGKHHALHDARWLRNAVQAVRSAAVTGKFELES